jgi:hypothetical protein
MKANGPSQLEKSTDNKTVQQYLTNWGGNREY